MKKYGLPYRGSKSVLADKILSILPAATNFYDLFAGGCAVTHCALEQGKYKNYFANDLQDAPRLFFDAVNGKYKNETRWISREQFFAGKDTNPYIRWCWAFGNNGMDYLFGKKIEPLKKAAHEYLIKNGYDGTQKSRLLLVKKFKADKGIQNRFELQQLQRLQQLEQLERLQRLQQLQQLERLQRLQQLEITCLDYREVKINPDAVVYCDIPYPHTGYRRNYYGVSFDEAAFYEWARTRPFPVYFSSCFADGFILVGEWPHRTRMNNRDSSGKKAVVEKLYWNGVKNENDRSARPVCWVLYLRHEGL